MLKSQNLIVLAGLSLMVSACGSGNASETKSASGGKDVKIELVSKESRITGGGVVRHCRIESKAKNRTGKTVVLAEILLDAIYPEEDIKLKVSYNAAVRAQGQPSLKYGYLEPGETDTRTLTLLSSDCEAIEGFRIIDMFCMLEADQACKTGIKFDDKGVFETEWASEPDAES